MAGFNVNLDALTENASRLGMRIQETFLENTRDLAARGGSALFLDAPEDKLGEIRKQLDVGSDREKLEALKRLIALISKGRNVSEYFAQVVKNVASPNLELRKLVYIYLLRYAEQEPDLALLSINTFQKDLNDPNPLIRAMALRVLSGIKVPMIGSIVVLAIKKCAADPSPYVRKAAAFAIPKCYSLDPSHLPELIGIITTLLKDQSPLSIGSTAVAFEAVCPTRLDLLHPHYRRFCRTLGDVDEWGQVNLTNLLVRYVRTMLAKPAEADVNTDPDLRLLLSCAEPLFMSRNPAVVLSVASAFYYVGPPSQMSKIVAPLLRIMESAREVERVVLSYLMLISHAHADLFAPHYTRLLVVSDDSTSVKTMKMQLLLRFVNNDNHQAILREFIDYAEDVDDRIVAHAIKAIGQIALSIPTASQQCLNALTGFIQSKHDAIVSNAVLVMKSLVQSEALSSGGTQSPLALVSKLAHRIEEIHHPQAKACVVWLVGQYARDTPQASTPAAPSNMTPWAPDVLRRTTKNFVTETALVKLQIITLAAKLVVLDPAHPTLLLLARYSLALARYDPDYDVRDRARMLSALLRGVAPGMSDDGAEPDMSGVVLRREQVQLVLFEGKLAAKPDDMSTSPAAEDSRALLGSLGVVTGRGTLGDRILPDWLEQGTESSLRDSPDDAPRSAVPTALGSATPRAISARASPVVLTPAGGSPAPGGARGAQTDLDQFYDDAGEEGESEEDEDEDEAEESEDSDGSEPEESEDESDDHSDSRNK